MSSVLVSSSVDKINLRGTTILMVTHAKDIVDQMNKRVVAIEDGHIVRDEQGQYGFYNEEEYYDYDEGVDKYVF